MQHGINSDGDLVSSAVKVAYSCVLSQFGDKVGELFFYGNNIADSSFYFDFEGTTMEKKEMEVKFCLLLDRQFHIVRQQVDRRGNEDITQYKVKWVNNTLSVKFTGK